MSILAFFTIFLFYLTGIASPIMSHSPATTGGSPCPTTTLSEQEADDDEMKRLLEDLEVEDTPTTPPISPLVPLGQLQVQVFYGSIPVHCEVVDCSKGPCRITSSSSSSSQEKGRFSGYPSGHTIILPESHPQSLSKGIFDAMENGILVEASEGRVFVTPLCRTIVYCSNSPSPVDSAGQIDKDQPTKVFDYGCHFRPTLEHYAMIQGQPPSPHFFLGLGQNWGKGRDISQNLVSIMITHLKSKQDVDTVGLPHSLISSELLTDSINVDQPTSTDLEAEAFLKNLQEISN